ncbi:hypothetical protein EMO89_00465 [Bifidobacterium tissieri]|uniref:Uncharacterized protein n=1 Tax=Bifidobacterium tissieri TaxID=1630162 RepID=A0A5M9ZWW7_9BIFI|nr:hypothetical protein [Bifidobacterium tissieri]KAA8832035.1 hypothetical protein EMO89_00465 [Bifidobacterium tissieri]
MVDELENGTATDGDDGLFGALGPHTGRRAPFRMESTFSPFMPDTELHRISQASGEAVEQVDSLLDYVAAHGEALDRSTARDAVRFLMGVLDDADTIVGAFSDVISPDLTDGRTVILHKPAAVLASALISTLDDSGRITDEPAKSDADTAVVRYANRLTALRTAEEIDGATKPTTIARDYLATLLPQLDHHYDVQELYASDDEDDEPLGFTLDGDGIPDLTGIDGPKDQPTGK